MGPFVLGAALSVAALSAVQALPSRYPTLKARASITALPGAQITDYTPYTYYASTGYCNASETLSWSCGANCEANPDFEPVASGGNGDSIQYCECTIINSGTLVSPLMSGVKGLWDTTLR